MPLALHHARTSAGPHTFEVRARDRAGNVDATPARRAFTVDIAAPETTITGGPSGPTRYASATFTFRSNEPTSKFECRVDGRAFAACPSTYTTAALPEGGHTFEVRAIDPAGNVDATPGSRTFAVDLTAPETTITAGPSGPTRDDTPTFAFSSSEASSTFQCRVDGAAFTACASPHTLGRLAAGVHTFEVRATDRAGNVDATPARTTVTISP